MKSFLVLAAFALGFGFEYIPGVVAGGLAVALFYLAMTESRK